MGKRFIIFGWVRALALSVLLLSTTAARAELCRLQSLLSGDPAARAPLPEIVQSFTAVANEFGAIDRADFDRFTADPFSFPLDAVNGHDFRSVLAALQAAFHEAPDRGSIRARTRSLLDPARKAVVETELSREDEADVVIGTRPVRFLTTPAGAVRLAINGEQYTDDKGALRDVVTGKEVYPSNHRGIRRLPQNPEVAPGLFLTRQMSQSMELWLDDSKGRRIKLDKSPFPRSIVNLLFLARVKPMDFDWQVSPDGKTIAVTAQSRHEFFRLHGPRPHLILSKISLYDVATGKRIGESPPVSDWHFTGAADRGASWYGDDVSILRYQADGKKIWLAQKMETSWHLLEWDLAANKIDRLDSHGGVRALNKFVLSEDGSETFQIQNRGSGEFVLSAVVLADAWRGSPFENKLEGPTMLSPDTRWLGTIESKGSTTSLIISSSSRGQKSEPFVLPDGVEFEGFTPDSRRLILRRKATGVGTTDTFALYAVEQWFDPKLPPVLPRAWRRPGDPANR